MRVVAENYEQTHTHIHTRDNYSNPRCKNARRGLKSGPPQAAGWFVRTPQTAPRDGPACVHLLMFSSTALCSALQHNTVGRTETTNNAEVTTKIFDKNLCEMQFLYMSRELSKKVNKTFFVGTHLNGIVSFESDRKSYVRYFDFQFYSLNISHSMVLHYIARHP